jgi:molybdopterin synthase catalytic subunit
MVFTDVTTEPIDIGELLARVGAEQDGAVLLFLGVVRNHAEGRAVSGMRYDAYEAMARDVLAQIAGDASDRHGTDRIAVVHRVGDLGLGETSLAIAVSTPHRAEAYAASREVIEEIKKRLPVWKKERYVDGDSAWVEGSVPPVGDASGGPG